MATAFTIFAAAALLAGCAAPYPQPQVELAHTPVVNLPHVQPVAASNGAIYQAASYRPLFEDHRARLIGDTLTNLVALSEPLGDLGSSLWLLTHPDLRQSARVRAFMDHAWEALSKRRGLLEGRGTPTP
eukprot:gene51838-69381_t